MANSKKNTIKIWILRGVLILLIVFWMSVIFGFSAEDGNESQSLSDKITIQVIQLINSDYEGLSPKLQEQYFNKVSFYVRKTGHFGEYGILGLLIGGLLITFEKIRSLKKAKCLLSEYQREPLSCMQ